MHVLGERVRAQDENEAEQDEQDLRGEVDHSQEDVQLRGLLDPDDVQGNQKDDHDRPPITSQGFVLNGSQKIER